MRNVGAKKIIFSLPHRTKLHGLRQQNFGGDEQAQRWLGEASSRKLFFELLMPSEEKLCYFGLFFGY